MSAKGKGATSAKKSTASETKKVYLSPTAQRAAAIQKALTEGTYKTKHRKVYTQMRFHRPHTLRLARKPTFPRTAIPSNARLDKYSILRYPLSTESAIHKLEAHNTLVFIVDIGANKHQIKDAVKKMYNVKAIKVNTLIRPDGKKKAFIRLSPDHEAVDVANKIGYI